MEGWAPFVYTTETWSTSVSEYRTFKRRFLKPICTGGRTVVLTMFWSSAGNFGDNQALISLVKARAETATNSCPPPRDLAAVGVRRSILAGAEPLRVRKL